MPQTQQTNDFTQGKVSTAVLRMALPLTVAQAVNVLYNLVDRMYIGRLEDSLAFTGLGLALPAVALILAFANLFGSGGAPMCSIDRGRGNLERASRVQGNAFVLLVGVGLLLTALGQVFLKPILYLLGASEATYPYAAAYLRIYLLGTVFVMISLGMNSFINAQGFARIGMITVTLGAVLNLALDPLFIFALDMGVRGAAIATVLSQGCSALWVFLFLRGKKAILRLDRASMRLDGALIRRMLALGLPGFVVSATNALVQAVANIQLRRYGGDLYVGVMTALTSVHEVVIMVIQGVTQGSQPVLGYNYGAGRNDRVIQGIRFITVVGVLYTLVVWALVMLFPGTVIRLFNSQPELVRVGTAALRIYFAGFCFMSLQFVGQSIFTGLGQAKQAICFSLLRKVVLVTVLMLILPGLWGLGTDGVFLAEPISNLLGGLACYITMYVTVWRPLKTPGARLPGRG